MVYVAPTVETATNDEPSVERSIWNPASLLERPASEKQAAAIELGPICELTVRAPGALGGPVGMTVVALAMFE